MDLYVKKEHEDGSASFELLETPPSAEAQQLMADANYIVGDRYYLPVEELLRALTARVVGSR